MGLLKIRSYLQKDPEAIVRIYNKAFRDLHSCWPNPMNLGWFMDRFGVSLEAKTGTAFLAEYNGAPIGYVILALLNRPQVGFVTLISGICVIPGFQRRGVGRRLVEKAIDWAKRQNAVLIENDDEIIENPIAVNFFGKLGFEIFHRGVCMSKDLTLEEPRVRQEKHEIRELRFKDLDRLLRVRREVFREFGHWYAKPDAEVFKTRMKNRIGRDDVKVYVAITNNQVIGYVVCTISETDKTLGDFRNISVLPEYRNMGFGTALMNRAFDYLREHKVQTATTVTETAEGFYRKVGFKVDSKFVRVRRQI